MMGNDMIYYRKDNNVEYIFYQNFTKSYPVHTHTAHITIGFVMDGEVCIVCHGQECVYHTGEYFCIMPDIPHEVKPVNTAPYTMLTACVPAGKVSYESEVRKFRYLRQLKQLMVTEPENVLRVKDMAKDAGVSPYHMIRQFKAACGLTPHQFQIQCRVRKAQKLLEEGISVTEAAYATGFCDQSHFDRCFRKIVRLTPSEYKKAASTMQG